MAKKRPVPPKISVRDEFETPSIFLKQLQEDMRFGLCTRIKKGVLNQINSTEQGRWSTHAPVVRRGR